MDDRVMRMGAVGGLIGGAMAMRPNGAVRSWTRTDSGPLVRLRRDGPCTRLRLYCLPYAGGTAGIFRPWCDLLPPGIDVWGVEYPGHGSRISEPLTDRIDVLAELVAEAVIAQPAFPYVLFGHSMGSLVAFEMVPSHSRKNAIVWSEGMISP